MNPELKQYIKDLLMSTVQRTFQRMQAEDTHRPFHAALLSPELLAHSRFERSFSTSFGQGAVEQISAAVLKYNGATNVTNQHATNVTIPINKEEAIRAHIERLRNSKVSGARPNWIQDLQDLHMLLPHKATVSYRVISDLHWFKNGQHNYASIKTVKPNIDQTAQAKKDLLALQANDPSCNTFFCMYYNPYGENRSDYNHAAPANIFNFQNDPCVLIGKDYWDHLGGIGFYDQLLDVFEEVGQQTRLMF